MGNPAADIGIAVTQMIAGFQDTINASNPADALNSVAQLVAAAATLTNIS